MAGSVLTRSELIAEIATDDAHLRAGDVETVVAPILDGIASALARGDRVELRRFGAFTVIDATCASDAIRGMAGPFRSMRNPFLSSRLGRNRGCAWTPGKPPSRNGSRADMLASFRGTVSAPPDLLDQIETPVGAVTTWFTTIYCNDILLQG
jgi:hypothetical protein